MEQISILSLSRLRNEEAFGYFKLVMSLLPYLLKEAEPENPDVVSVEGGVSALSGSGEVINAMLEAPINAFEAAYQAFDVALESSTADSAEAKAYEELRDRLWRSNNAYIKAMTAHPNPELAAIAERVKAEFDKYGDVTYLPVVQESGALHNLIQDIRTISAQDRSKIHYEEWFNALETAESEQHVHAVDERQVGGIAL